VHLRRLFSAQRVYNRTFAFKEFGDKDRRSGFCRQHGEAFARSGHSHIHHASLFGVLEGFGFG
jgi:hypothetical protein